MPARMMMVMLMRVMTMHLMAMGVMTMRAAAVVVTAAGLDLIRGDKRLRCRGSDACVRRRGKREETRGSKRKDKLFHLSGFPC